MFIMGVSFPLYVLIYWVFVKIIPFVTQIVLFDKHRNKEENKMISNYAIFTMLNALFSLLLTLIVVLGFSAYYSVHHSLDLHNLGITQLIAVLWFFTLFGSIQALFGDEVPQDGGYYDK